MLIILRMLCRQWGGWGRLRGIKHSSIPAGAVFSKLTHQGASMIKPVRSLYFPRGLTLTSLLFLSVMLSFAALLVIKVFPTINEYFTIQKAIDRIVRQAATPQEARTAFEKQKQIEYTIESIGGADLFIAKKNDKLVISFAYVKEIELFDPVFLVIKYKGRSE